MNQDFETVLSAVVGIDDKPSLSGIDAAALAAQRGDSDSAHLSRITGAFLLSLCGGRAAATGRATLQEQQAKGCSQAHFLSRLNRWVTAEQQALSSRGGAPATKLRQAARWANQSPANRCWDQEAQKAIWGFLFPEGAACLDDPDQTVSALRRRRTVRIDKLNPRPIADPIGEVLLTSNVLLTLPPDAATVDHLPYSSALRDQIKKVTVEQQKYWFDHPIPLDVEAEANEIIHGLRGLDDAVAFEKARGNAAADARLTCALSVSVTHAGISPLARDYLQEALASAPAMPHLDVYVFSEATTSRLIDEVLAPIAREYLADRDLNPLRQVFGVDGEYGRHYSFLKAVSALWQILIDHRVRATFKIDLDQVFPQAQLVAEGSGSAFDHFRSALWGAQGTDSNGRMVEMGMLAGALVNEQDIAGGLFTPDVPRPKTIPRGEAVSFFNRLPMALSTEAEMMTRYDGRADHPNGRDTCLQRIHVTGGTNGILVDALRRHRPFTPTFIGRAEDQAYLLSTLFADPRSLRYVHSAGLIMRHDKDAFAGAAIEAGKVGRFVGDLVRTLYFSHYVTMLPWPDQQIKEAIDPFTGCFASHIPTTLVALRLALRVGELLGDDDQHGAAEAIDLMNMAADRLDPLIEQLQETPSTLAEELAQQRAGWDLYYDALQAIERNLASENNRMLAIRDTARQIVESCRIDPRTEPD